jgi:Uma2 family endonuclease
MVPAELDLANLLPASFTAPGMDEEQFLALCAKFPDATLEYTEDGTVIIMPPTDPESSERVQEVTRQLGNWARETAGGHVVGPDGGFRFPGGSRRSPDAAWFSDDRWKEARRKHPRLRFPPFSPEFVIEVRSPDDRIRALREKMEEYMVNGVLLGWLIDPLERRVEIYRPTRPVQVLENPPAVEGDGPVAGFLLKLDRIFPS